MTFLSQLFKIYYTYVRENVTERHGETPKKNLSPSLHTRAVHVTRFSRVLRNGLMEREESVAPRRVRVRFKSTRC